MPLKSLVRSGACEQKPVDYLASVTQTGKCEQASTPTPSSPVDIKCNNGVIKVSRNLCDVNSTTARIGYYIASNGTVTTDVYNWMYKDFIPVSPSTTYTLSFSQSVYFVSISEYSSADDSGFVVRKVGSTGSNTKLTITTGATTKFIRFGTNIDRTTVTLDRVLAINWMLTQTATSQAYRPYKELYTQGTPEVIIDAEYNIATAVNLLGVGTYADTQEIISGAVGRKAGVYVFDGTETNWRYISGVFAFDNVVPAKAVVICTHFVNVDYSTSISNQPDLSVKGHSTNTTIYFKYNALTSLTDWTAFLAAQYRAGTPVIVVYPLATETTESVPGQMLVKSPLTVGAEVTVPTLATTTQTYSTPDPNHKLPIWCNNGELKWNGTAVVADGTPEVLTVVGKNLFDIDTVGIEQGAIASASGTNIVSNYRVRTVGYCPVKSGTNYTISAVVNGYTGVQQAGVYVFEYSEESAEGYIGSAGGWRNPNGYAFTTRAETRFIRLVFAKDNSGGERTYPSDVSNIQLEYGNTATAYEPYTGQTASVPMLLSVGDYKDEAELISGLLTHKVGVMVFNGTEAWRASSSANIYILDSAIAVNLTASCTHFLKVSNTTSAANMPDGSFKGHSSNAILYFKDVSAGNVDGFKALLASRYAAGDPVIVLYPLNTPITEQGTAQPITANAGTNVISSQLNVQTAEASVKYYK